MTRDRTFDAYKRWLCGAATRYLRASRYIPLWLLLTCRPAFPAGTDQATVSITFDLVAAQAVLSLFDSNHPTKEDVAALLNLPAVRATIVQTGRFDAEATEQGYVESLWSVLNGRAPESDPFRFLAVRDRLTGLRKSIWALSERQDSISGEIADRMAHYTPMDVTIETTLHAVLGGTSDGWAPGDGSFYVALHYFRDDVPGLTAMLVHETYHIAQQAFFSTEVDATQTQTARSLISNLLAEGTATLAGNPFMFQGDGQYLETLQGKHSKNIARIQENFALFEALYLRAMIDPDVRFGQLYNLGFSGGWDSPLYFVGFRIAEGLEKYLGRKALVELLANKTGSEVLAEYIRVYTENDDPELVKFTSAVEARIQGRD